MGALLLTLLAQVSAPPLVSAEGLSTPPPAVGERPFVADAGTPWAQPSTPPLIRGDTPIAAPPPARATPVETEPERLTALHFAPLSLFATHLSFELERALTSSLTVFGSLGASLVLQVGLDAGLRFYVSDRALRGAFISAQGSVFYFSQLPIVLVGPGAMFGYVFRPREGLALGIGAGIQLWYQPSSDSGLSVLGITPNADVIFMPGFQRPGTHRWAPQPLLRFTVGPAF